MKRLMICLLILLILPLTAQAAKKKKKKVDNLAWPPKIPGGKLLVTDTSPEFLKPTDTLKPGVAIAKIPPKVDFMYYQGQSYSPTGGLWSAWGDVLAVGDKCYSTIGDHCSPGGNAFLYEYDAKTKQMRQVLDARSLIKAPDGHYTPGKFHSRVDLGSDGWLYFSTHRGSTRTTVPANHFKGGWIMRYHPETEKGEIVATAPLPMQTLPSSILDPDRLIFYAGTADGDYKNKRIMFLAYDVKKRKVIYSDDYGPYRYAILSRKTGNVYFHGDPKFSSPSRTDGPGKLVRFNPDKPGKPTPIGAALGLRTATQETPQGIVYTVDHDNIWAFDTKTEKAKHLGPTAAGNSTYTTSIDAGPNGRYLYYVPGAHGRSEQDGSPLIQYDTKTNKRKVIAFLHPFYHKKYGFIPCGAFGTDVSPDGTKVYITWNGNRNTPQGYTGRVKFDTCAFMVVHIPESERKP